MKKCLLNLIISITLVVLSKQAIGQGAWTQRADFGGGYRFSPFGLVINGLGYIGNGYNNINFMNDFWAYDPTLDVWTQKANFSGLGRTGSVAFAIGNFGYIGTGYQGTYLNDFWKYDSGTNTWTQIANFPGGNRTDATGFSIGSLGYVGTGKDNTGAAHNDFWEYNPSSNIWTQKANLTGIPRYHASSFTINGFGYIGGGGHAVTSILKYLNDFWAYNPISDTWSQKANVPDTIIQSATFSIGNYGYISTGVTSLTGLTNATWKYDPATDNWTQVASFGGQARSYAAGFSIGNKGYVGTGGLQNGSEKDFWEYDPNSNGTNELENQISISISPNPFSSSTILQTTERFQNASLTIYNSTGRMVKHIDKLDGQAIIFHRNNLTSGLYFIRLTQDSKVFSADKLVITD